MLAYTLTLYTRFVYDVGNGVYECFCYPFLENLAAVIVYDALLLECPAASSLLVPRKRAQSLV